MRNENKQSENLRQLTEQFFDSAQARQVRKDLEKGNQLLRQADDLKVPDELAKSIKTDIRVQLKNRKRNYKPVMIMKIAAVAAAVAIVFILSSHNGTKVEVKPLSQNLPETKSVWEHFESQEDIELALLSEEIEELASAIRAVNLSDSENGYATVSGETDNLEAELIEVETIFWKG
ncbi:MAG: hypothetical protein K8R02_09545 [Anaerohalosphaeraceae bacterium]|nr:hypothetical protein [Anaerohalosphaeraceae bacterium]